MERTKYSAPPPPFNVEEEPIVLSKQLIDLLLKDKATFTGAIALYCFYYYTAKWQKTNQPRVTVAFASKGIGCSERRIQVLKKVLIDLNLIKDITVRDSNGRIVRCFVKVNFIWSSNINTSRCGQLPGVEPLQAANLPTNALSTVNRNALSANIGNTTSGGPTELNLFSTLEESSNNQTVLSSLDKSIVPSLFEPFWKDYPKHPDKGKALKAWLKICKLPPKERPTWRMIRTSIKEQKRSPRWQEHKFIPHPATWLNQSRWLDDASEMKTFEKRETEKPNYISAYGEKWFLDNTDGNYYNNEGRLYR